MSKSLRILVPVKRVIDYAIKPRVNKTQTGIETSGVKHSLNPFDELSIEEAVRLRERHTKTPESQPLHVSSIIAISAGPAKCADTLRTALAMGADRAIHVNIPEDEPLEPLGVAKLLKAIAEKEDANLVLVGKQAIDDDSAQTGPMVAGLLGWGQATQASKVEIQPASAADGSADGMVEVTQEVDGGTETVRVPLPAVVTTDLRLNEPRYASLPNIMKAKKKPLEKKEVGDFEGLDVRRRLKVVKVREPEARQGGGKVEDVDGLIKKMKELGAI